MNARQSEQTRHEGKTVEWAMDPDTREATHGPAQHPTDCPISGPRPTQLCTAISRKYLAFDSLISCHLRGGYSVSRLEPSDRGCPSPRVCHPGVTPLPCGAGVTPFVSRLALSPPTAMLRRQRRCREAAKVARSERTRSPRLQDTPGHPWPVSGTSVSLQPRAARAAACRLLSRVSRHVLPSSRRT